MDCVLFRHGVAVTRDEWDEEEAERPLTPEGIGKTRDAAKGLQRLALEPAHLLSSPFVRAVQSAELIREVFRLKDNIRLCDELLPDAHPDLLLSLLASFAGNACLICVGHEPHLGLAAGLMVAGKPLNRLSLKKAGACCVRFDGTPKAGAGALRWWLMPSQLRLLTGKKG